MTDRGGPIRPEAAFLGFRRRRSGANLHGEQEVVAGEAALEALDGLVFRDMGGVAAGKRVVDGDDGFGGVERKPCAGCSGAGQSRVFGGD